MPRLHSLLGFVFLTALAACGGDDGGRKDNEIDVVDVIFVPDVTIAPTDAADARDADAETGPETAEACLTPGAIGCECVTGAECNSGVCIEGPDGNICTQTCIEECPEGYDCLATSIGGGDPISICLPRHTRLCRPCEEAGDCKNPLDPNPGACVPDADPSVGSFCATSCAQIPCPSGYACEDVVVGEGLARLCMKEDGACECRPAWAALALTTRCENAGEGGSCEGSRTCTAAGLTDCSAATPASETCNGLDDDCNGTTDDIAVEACDLTNDLGTCQGTMACVEGAPICAGASPRAEACNAVDDDCNGETDETWNNCLPSGCNESDGAFVETGDPSCVNGQCAYTNPRPCGLYTCVGGADQGDTCAASCVDDTTCVASAHCDETTNTCVPDVPDGGACGDETDCLVGHCQNGFCCAAGDCCNQPSDCPASYAQAATCETPAQCQGSRRDARCVSSMCALSEPLADDSGCGAELVAVDCTPNVPRYCNGLTSQSAPTCPTTCASDADCAAGFHCDGTCVPDVVNGGTCDEDTDCLSEHCENGFCCNEGACCAVASDCPDTFRDPAACLDAFVCQGERIDATCVSNTCDSTTVNDDSGCDENVEANGCGPFKAVYCSGAATQTPPQCSFACSEDSDCDSGFHCDVICVPNLPDGNFCDEASDCMSGHCQNGLCCASGDCCNLATDCPASYASPSVCDNPAACQGTRDGAACGNHMCSTVGNVGDDTACTSATVANTCGPYPSVRCVGGASQQAPTCANSCSSNAECDADYYCNAGTCQPKKPPGTACTDSAQCNSGHCQNGFCCASGDCCASKNDCSPAIYGTPSVCLDGPSCQGQRKDTACTATFQCAIGPNINDDSGCAGFEADTCGYFESVFCSAATAQGVPSCLGTCTSDNQCDNGAHCENGQCVPDQDVGGVCENSSQCGSGLACVDQRCCESSCTGVCRRCDSVDAPGVCTIPPAGLDPDNECGAVNCTGYYSGFVGQTCFGKSNLTAAQVACDSDGGCETAADICPSAAQGAATLTCNATCQVPTADTCEGTTPGACTNVSGGTQTCGVGECANTIDRCLGGAPQTCSPKQPGLEVCDGKDNDCDGLTDAADPDLIRVPCDNQNGVCSGAMRPAALCAAGVWQPCGNPIYAANSALFQPGTEVSCDGSDNDCDGAADDDFTYVSPAGTSIRGANKPCGVGVCAGGTTQCGAGNSLQCSTDTRIVAEICDGADNDCDDRSDSLDPSLVLIDCQNQSGVCNGSKRAASLCAAGSWQLCQAAEYEAHDPRHETDETLCDGADNDCNNLVDDGLTGPLNSNQQGVCAGSRKACSGTGGFVDSYTSVPNYNANESVPDGNFRDENCDGVDGDIDLAWFVSPTGSGSTCSRAAPCTLAVALTLTARPHIYVQAGTHTGPYAVSRSVQIFGGYNSSWVRQPRGTAGHGASIFAAAYGTQGHPTAFAISGPVSVTLADLILRGVNASGTWDGNGRSSYVVHATNQTLLVERCSVIAGNGANANPGAGGTSASSSKASTGGTGGGGDEPCNGGCSTGRPGGGAAVSNSSCGGTTSGAGGAGGSRDTECGFCGLCECAFDGDCSARSGLAGDNASVTSGTDGTGGNGSGTCSGSNGAGRPGRIIDGSGGGGASSARGRVDANLWVGFRGGNGSLGEHGGGGGGGGGAGGCNNGGCDASGGGGGGGGAGGCRASTAGTGGYAGGGSFGIFAVSVAVSVFDTEFTRGSGGAGGNGGSGGNGQPGGDGGAGGAGIGNNSDGSYSGKNGGNGGRGGHAGGGGGGGGGVSYGVFHAGGTVTTTVGRPNSFAGGSGGGGGNGGTSGIAGGGGVDGATGTIYNCSNSSSCP